MQDNDKSRAAQLRKRLGQALKAARKKAKLSHVALGARIQLDSGNLSRIENGHQWISDLVLARISRALGVPIWTLLAHAEEAINSSTFELLQTYQNSNDEGKALIDQAITVARRHYQKDTGATDSGEKHHGSSRR
jgi:transcriptional regulator with XRE-family HTH domain